MENIKLTLIKTEDYNLRPYGNYTIKWKTRQQYLPNIIPFNELEMKHDTSMPLTDEQDKQVVKYMVKHKTDILFDGHTYYTRAGNGLTEVFHKKLVTEYKKES